MKTARALHLTVLLAVGLAVSVPAFAAGRYKAPALDGGRITAPGVYDISIVYIPGISVPGGLPECVDQFAQQIYVGQLTVVQTATGYTLSFEGANEADPKLTVKASANFNANWGGFLLGMLGGREDALTGIDVANLESGSVSGKIMGQNGSKGNLKVKVGAAGTIESCSLKGKAAH